MATPNYDILLPMANRYIAERGLRVSPRATNYERVMRAFTDLDGINDKETIEAALNLMCLEMSQPNFWASTNCHCHQQVARPTTVPSHQMTLRSHAQTHMVLRNGRGIRHVS